mgnify:CR=1 FL=1
MSVYSEYTLKSLRFDEGAIGRSTIFRWLQELNIRRKSYNQTVFELSWCSDRDLSDLGIARCDIRRLAREAADLKAEEFRAS